MAKGDKLLWPEIIPARFAEGTFGAMCAVKRPNESLAAFIREAVDLLIAERERERAKEKEKGK